MAIESKKMKRAMIQKLQSIELTEEDAKLHERVAEIRSNIEQMNQHILKGK